ncbi:SDR family NAD-dependent epimerase/dehydratase [Halorubrum sp. Atlit-8R]|uniref:NAD-dependent epimerase/dehydratase family protein n=1 Tax=unclassified Halorubrum TaxID=2642239 RepID=UPI000EF228FF|nr:MULTISPECIES: SDR family oxidoreductase [unclassified Halorubrum]RLM70757.1 SDR family NAD-dependent epimerase/dehydratase [Halorubrum sp. Atlit-9R]RLM71625.1 SDR family NAD-dependent epimerase/dehydratase [Halorubrum sp. Atlit-9R]RLM83090.1 SDR family NAD-dependent epimerase/dehydratase [Halorubrum sp. Atlit-8R]
MRVLVTGGAGYIGNFIIEELLNTGHEVRVLDSMLWGDDALAPFADDDDLEIHEGDIRHIEDLSYAVQGCDAIVHMAGIVGDPACGVNEQATQSVNVEATKSLVEVAKLYDIDRLVFASTCSVYGASELMELNEGSYLNPLSLYAESKIDSEEIILHETHDQFADTDITATILRLGTIFGWSRRMRFDLVVNILTAKAVLEGDIPVYGGEQYRPLVHVHDAARAFSAVLEADKEDVDHQIFNVGDNNLNYQIKKVGRIVEENVDGAEVRFVEHKEDNRTYRVSFDKINYILGWETEYDIADGVQEIKEWMEEEDITDYEADQFRNSDYPYI